MASVCARVPSWKRGCGAPAYPWVHALVLVIATMFHCTRLFVVYGLPLINIRSSVEYWILLPHHPGSQELGKLNITSMLHCMLNIVWNWTGVACTYPSLLGKCPWAHGHFYLSFNFPANWQLLGAYHVYRWNINGWICNVTKGCSKVYCVRSHCNVACLVRIIII